MHYTQLGTKQVLRHPCLWMTADLVPKVAASRKHHRNAALIAGRYDLFVADRSTWLDDGRDPGCDCRLDSVGKGEGVL